jgi:hypothetical protein
LGQYRQRGDGAHLGRYAEIVLRVAIKTVPGSGEETTAQVCVSDAVWMSRLCSRRMRNLPKSASHAWSAFHDLTLHEGDKGEGAIPLNARSMWSHYSLVSLARKRATQKGGVMRMTGIAEKMPEFVCDERA